MSTTTIEFTKKELHTQQALHQTKWQRLILLFVLGYEGLGCLAGGALLIIKPDGRLMDMPVDMMNGVFRDFMIPGVILFSMGILTTAAFFAVLRKTSTAWFIACLALYGLAIWFWVEINILEELHWLHVMWGLPVILGGWAAIPLMPYDHPAMRRVLLLCGMLSSLLYIAMNIIVPMTDPGYSTMDQMVSEISAIGAPTRLLWNYLAFGFILLFAAFGWGVWHSRIPNKNLHIAGILIFVYSVVSVFWTPMHQREELAAGGGTISDTLHIVFTMVTGIILMVAIGFSAAALGRSFRLYSIITILLMITFGAITGTYASSMEANLPTPYCGIWERLSIAASMVWVIVFSIILLKKEKSLLN